MQIYDPRAYYNAVRDRWAGTVDFSGVAAQSPQGTVAVQSLQPVPAIQPAPGRPTR